jgi:elongation factor Ts
LEVQEGVISKYIHTPMGPDVGKIGVLVAVESSSSNVEALTELGILGLFCLYSRSLLTFVSTSGIKVAMHVAAASPQFLKVQEVSREAEDKEKSIFLAQAAESGKKAEHMQKMVDGRVRKWHQEVVLLEQEFLIAGEGDKKKSVRMLLPTHTHTLYTHTHTHTHTHIGGQVC